MDPLSATSSLIGLASVLKTYKDVLSRSRDQPGLNQLEQQLRHTAAQLRLISSILSCSPQLPEYFLEDVEETSNRVRAAIKRLEAVFKNYNESSKPLRPAKLVLDKRTVGDIAELDNTVDKLCSQFKLHMALNTRQQINVLHSLAEATAKYFESSLSDLRNDLNSLVRLLAEKFEQPLENFTDSSRDMGERQRDFEELREALRRNLGSTTMRPFAFDPFCFPFVIVSPDRQESVGGPVQVKLDTGAHDSWVGKHVLERHGLDFDLTDDQRVFIGAGRGGFRALGKVTLIWYSENQALTKKTNFLVGEELPFDVILGSDYLMDDLNTDPFKTPILPLRSILTREELQELEKTQREKGAKAEDIRKIQKEQNLKNFEERRKAKRESRLTTPAYPGTSSSFLFPSSTPTSISRRSSFASRSVTPGASRLSSREPSLVTADITAEDGSQATDNNSTTPAERSVA
ncbi:hypothetical protein F5B22DRAFT_107636 [Xylaria bambusicola]|uniref:uncharacterized protein n=1 Tax=Xylaria bambusicola TaxID=326684 RepID=UPI002008740B|nr:uncharacterized protein F5B22DRAFT_107636 [Xylaria bambusicola]KAI0517496.1 hypothetical protein F5B22DRAFT_107636 [Xylaria bambusicola]